jgi:hypothetical protein
VPSWTIEMVTQLWTATFSWVVTPALVGIAYTRWTKGSRLELPRWRNGAGLASMVIVSALWLWLTTSWVLGSNNRGSPTSYGTNWTEFEVFLPAYYLYMALPLALVLKGVARPLMIAACVAVAFIRPA